MFCTLHAKNVFAGCNGIVVVKAGKNPVGDLLDHQFFVGFTFLSTPKNTVRVPFHVVDILPGTVVLFIAESNGEAGFYALCIHSPQEFTILVPLGNLADGREKGEKQERLPGGGQKCSYLLQ